MRTARLGVEDGRVRTVPGSRSSHSWKHSAAAALGLRRTPSGDGVGRAQGWRHGDVLIMQAWGRRRSVATTRPVTGSAPSGRVRGVRGSLDAARAQLLDCRIALRSGATSRAQHALERGVLSRRDGRVPSARDGTGDRRGPLAERLGHFGDGDELVRDIRRCVPRAPVPPTIPLTERECDVLELLPTLLSLDEIAEAVSVSINTVAPCSLATRQARCEIACGRGRDRSRERAHPVGSIVSASGPRPRRLGGDIDIG